MLRFNASTRGGQRKVQAVRTAMPGIMEEASALIAEQFVRTMDREAPRDTQRYVRAWILAGNATGATNMPVPALQTSGYAREHRERLDRQIAYWTKAVQRLHGPIEFWEGAARRSSRGLRGEQRVLYRKAKAALEKAEKVLGDARRELALYDAATSLGQAPILIYGNTTGRNGKPRRRLMATVRAKVYGGFGRVVRDPQRGLVYHELVNAEAHAKIIESRTKLARRSIAQARAAATVMVRDRVRFLVSRASQRGG